MTTRSCCRQAMHHRDRIAPSGNMGQDSQSPVFVVQPSRRGSVRPRRGRAGGGLLHAARRLDRFGARCRIVATGLSAASLESEDSVPRVKRPMPDREGPIRSWVAATDSESRDDPGNDRRAESESAVDQQDPIVRGVVAGGRVVDEWIRQAQQTARLLGGTTLRQRDGRMRAVGCSRPPPI